ncbi:hypothetical protein SAMN04487917_101182 [Arthrobacter sp. yr096]|uniref:hypothetical protein n=1 Tax=Arthrobacter sp. yr096 TaxID=1761750 RepID=UPI0008D105E9|nr:hypothetical protein [Arthrobacter sp. yr096]SEI42016.1 hypothetical protein SAMN04487917_101182 [Arthrobacter sp. yr096]
MSKITAPLHIRIQKPKADGSRVVFSFSASRDIGLQSRNRWYIDYQGLDVTHVAAEMFTMVFLAWQLPVFLQSRAQSISISAEFPVSEDVWLFVERLMRNKGISLKRVQFDGLVARRPEATDGTPGYGYRQRKTLSVVPDGLPRGVVREILTKFTDPKDLSFRSLDVIFDAKAEAAWTESKSELSSSARFSSDFGVTLRRVALGAAPRAFSAYVLAAVPGLIAGGFTRYATFLGGNRFWQHVGDSASIGNSGQRTENFQALSDFLATAVNYPVQFANVGRSLSGLGAVKALNRLAPEWSSWHSAAIAGSEVWATRTAGVLAFFAASVERDGQLSAGAKALLKGSRIYSSMLATVRGNALIGWDGNIGWESRLGIPDFELMELHELCNNLCSRSVSTVESDDSTFWDVIAPFGKRGYPDLWNLRQLRPDEYRNGFEECISVVLNGVLETSDWRGEYPLRSEAVKFTETVELPRPWPMSFRVQRVSVG